MSGIHVDGKASDFKPVDFDRRVVSPMVYVDPEIYRLEQERIFAKTWQFVGHESQIPQNGDYVRAPMGEETVIVWRADKDEIGVFLNSCPHRGTPLCRDDAGTRKMMVCPYHGWSFDLRGNLRGIPMFADTYQGNLDRKDWGLIRVPRVETYRGLIFACFDESVEPLRESLGDLCYYLDSVFNRTAAGNKVLPGVQRWIVDANWKFGTENLAGDQAHTISAHSSVLQLFDSPIRKIGRSNMGGPLDLETALPNGHSWASVGQTSEQNSPAVIAHYERVRAEAATRLTPTQMEYIGIFFAAAAFPNFCLLYSGCTTMRVMQPLAHNKTQIWAWTVTDADASDEVIADQRRRVTGSFSSSGIFEQDDGILWAACQQALEAGTMRRKFPMSYLQGGEGSLRQQEERPGVVRAAPTEASLINFYTKWCDQMGYAE
jgi:phenylpropionate dioxygenase-like ring-hydroxylating dioxygenase large terminal subunit